MKAQEPIASGLVSFENWLAELGKTRITGYRWRKAGIVETVNIFGRQYIRREQIEDFERRAQNGDFAKAPHTPKKDKSTSTTKN